MKRGFITIAAALLLSPALQAQEKSRFSVDGGITLSSAYLWRGDAVCGLHANPDVRFHWGGFTLETYSYLALDGSYKEIDWDLQYTLADFTLHLADYYYNFAGMRENYFSWKMGETTHVDEVALVYDCSAFPLIAKWFTFFWGDWKTDSRGLPFGVSFSSYAEIGTYRKLDRWGTVSAAVGASVLPGTYTNYTRNFAVIHTELKYTKTIELDPISIPLGVTFMINPYARTCHVAAAVGLNF